MCQIIALNHSFARSFSAYIAAYDIGMYDFVMLCSVFSNLTPQILSLPRF